MKTGWQIVFIMFAESVLPVEVETGTSASVNIWGGHYAFANSVCRTPNGCSAGVFFFFVYSRLAVLQSHTHELFNKSICFFPEIGSQRQQD